MNEELTRKVEDYKVEGWSVKEEHDNRVVMHKPNFGTMIGHLLVAVFTLWWSFGVGNLVYLGFCYLKRTPQTVVRPD